MNLHSSTGVPDQLMVFNYGDTPFVFSSASLLRAVESLACGLPQEVSLSSATCDDEAEAFGALDVDLDADININVTNDGGHACKEKAQKQRVFSHLSHEKKFAGAEAEDKGSNIVNANQRQVYEEDMWHRQREVDEQRMFAQDEQRVSLHQDGETCADQEVVRRGISSDFEWRISGVPDGALGVDVAGDGERDSEERAVENWVGEKRDCESEVMRLRRQV